MKQAHRYCVLAAVFLVMSAKNVNVYAAEKQGGGADTGGGSAILCYRGNTLAFAESYDHFKAQAVYGQSTVASNQNYIDQVRTRVAALNQIDPKFSDKLLALSNSFSPQAIASGNGEVGIVAELPREGEEAIDVIPDLAAFNKSHGCTRSEVARVARFLEFAPLGHYKYNIRADFMKVASQDQIAWLVQHEMIYSLAKMYLGDQTSQSAQAYNAYFGSGAINQMSPMQYVEFLTKLSWLGYSNSRLSNKLFSVRIGQMQLEMGPNSPYPCYKYTNSANSFSCLGPAYGQSFATFQGQTISFKPGQSAGADSNGNFRGSLSVDTALRFSTQDIKFISYLVTDIYNSPTVSNDYSQISLSQNEDMFCGTVDSQILKYGPATLEVFKGTRLCVRQDGSPANKSYADSSKVKIPILHTTHGDLPLMAENLGEVQFSADGKLTNAVVDFRSNDWYGKPLVLDGKVIKSEYGEKILCSTFKLQVIDGKYSLKRTDSSRKCKE
jgi:hypothetical protein